MKKILFFDEEIVGHHLEYLNHFFLKAVCYSDIEFVFAIPKSFQDYKQKWYWPSAPNIRFRFLTNDELVQTENKSLLSIALHGSCLIRKIVKETQADSIFLIYLQRYMPFLPFLIPGYTTANGIIYKIYLYAWPDTGFFRKAIDVFLYWLYARMPCFDRIFILNDRSSTAYLNKIWKTDRFTYLTDPYSGDTKKVCTPGNVHNDKLIFLHFGALAKRKGTIDILYALKTLSKVEQEKIHFIFAGQVLDEIKTEFYQLTDELGGKIEIDIYDDYLPLERIEEFCAISDYILVPYYNTAQSSGVISYAAKYSVPVIGPKKGLLGKIIRTFKLGITLQDINAESICNQIKNCIQTKRLKTSSDYLSCHTVSDFQNQIFSTLTLR